MTVADEGAWVHRDTKGKNPQLDEATSLLSPSSLSEEEEGQKARRAVISRGQLVALLLVYFVEPVSCTFIYPFIAQVSPNLSRFAETRADIFKVGLGIACSEWRSSQNWLLLRSIRMSLQIFTVSVVFILAVGLPSTPYRSSGDIALGMVRRQVRKETCPSVRYLRPLNCHHMLRIFEDSDNAVLEPIPTRRLERECWNNQNYPRRSDKGRHSSNGSCILLPTHCVDFRGYSWVSNPVLT